MLKKNEKGYVRNEVVSVAIAHVQMLLIDLSVSAKLIPECVCICMFCKNTLNKIIRKSIKNFKAALIIEPCFLLHLRELDANCRW